jgi:hypothetical protein
MESRRHTLATPQRDDEKVLGLAGLSTTNDADVKILGCLSLTIRIGEIRIVKELYPLGIFFEQCSIVSVTLGPQSESTGLNVLRTDDRADAVR